MHMVSIALRYTPGHPPCDPHHCCSLALAAAMTFWSRNPLNRSGSRFESKFRRTQSSVLLAGLMSRASYIARLHVTVPSRWWSAI